MILYHGKKIIRRERGYEMSIIIFIALLIMFVACYASPASREYLYAKIYTPASIAILCFTGFSEITGVYRAFRVRSLEAFFLAIAGFVLLMHFAPSMASSFLEWRRWPLGYSTTRLWVRVGGSS
jgi:uncharacterized integral membrane protein